MDDTGVGGVKSYLITGVGTADGGLTWRRVRLSLTRDEDGVVERLWWPDGDPWAEPEQTIRRADPQYDGMLTEVHDYLSEPARPSEVAG